MKTFSKNTFLLAALLSAGFLTACGGGGSDGTPAQNVAAAGPVVPPPQTTVPGVDPAPQNPAPGVDPAPTSNLLMTMPIAPYPQGSAEQRSFDAINVLRIKGGFGASSYNEQMAKAAAAHVIYQVANDDVGHYEIAGRTGFTGVTPQDRCNAAALGTALQGQLSCGEGGSASGYTMSTVNLARNYSLATGHLQGVLNYAANFSGMDFDSDTITSYYTTAEGVRIPLNTIDSVMGTVIHGIIYSAPRIVLGPDKANSIVGIYPFDGMTGVGIGYATTGAGELFKPIRQPAGHDAWDGTGMNIMAQFPGFENPIVTVFTLRKEGDTVDTPSRIQEAGMPNGTEPTKNGWAILVANKLLVPNSKYNVTLRGTYNGTPFDKTWSFTTGVNSHSDAE